MSTDVQIIERTYNQCWRIAVHSQFTPSAREKNVRNELIYFREIRKSKVLFNPSLFRVNNISHEDRLLKLCALLAKDISCGEPSTLPSNNDAEIVTGVSSLTTKPTKHQIQVGKYTIQYTILHF